ncbi:MAG: threonine/serine dehydratase [Thermaerobacter sp.]|nr:threonine/serine dehydratase [Thermaerobacter sp.]
MRSQTVRLDDIVAAQDRLSPYLKPTPLQPSTAAAEAVGGDVLLKLEMFQPIRVFKIRGALNRILRLRAQGLSGGVITASAGNHGLAVAYAAERFGLQATICVPQSGNQAKVRAITRLGARVVAEGEDFQAAVENARRIAAAEGLTFVHAYDDPDVIAGQGTLGLELTQAGVDFDAVLLPIGGGGLLGGASLALKERMPKIKVYGIAMSGADSMARSLAAGKVVELQSVHTIADGLSPRGPSALTLELAQRYVDDVIVIDDEDLYAALRLLLFEEHLVVEPSGAATLAALMRHGSARFGKRPVSVLSGGFCADEVLRQVAQMA